MQDARSNVRHSWLNHTHSCMDATTPTDHRQESQVHLGDVASVEADTLDRPPDEEEAIPQSKLYRPLDLPVLLILAPASMLGVLARLGIIALATFEGNSIFPLAYAQAVGCLVMGFALRLKEPLGD